MTNESTQKYSYFFSMITETSLSRHTTNEGEKTRDARKKSKLTGNAQKGRKKNNTHIVNVY
jgi:hypothetical protein